MATMVLMMALLNFLQGTKSTELEAPDKVVQVQPKMCGKDFDATVSYLGQMATKKSYNMQSVYNV